MINNNTIYFYCTLHTIKSQSTTGESIKKRQTSSHNTIKKIKKKDILSSFLSELCPGGVQTL